MKQLKQFPMGTLYGDPLPGAPELAARGKFSAGVRTITLTMPGCADIPAGQREGKYPRIERTLKTEVWYPAAPAEDAEPAVYTDHMGRNDLGNLEPFSIQGRAYRDAPADPKAGPRPVVVISHGYPGSRFLLVNLAENLSSKGYVVLSIGHEGNTYEDFLPQGSMETALIHRSLDQRFVIGQLPRLNEEGFLKGLLQPENVCLIGFSMGGYGALRTVGARFSDASLTSFHAFADELSEPEGYHGLSAVKAAVLFAPAAMWFDPMKTEDITVPTLWFCGTSDHVVQYGNVHDFCRQARRSDRVFVSYQCCGHNVANNPAPPQAQSASWEIYKRWSDPVWDTWRLNNANIHFLTAFLRQTLEGDDSFGKYLTPPASDQESARLPGFVEGTDAGILLERFPAEG